MNPIATHAILLAVGFFALIKGAGIFVDGSSALAEKLGISKAVIGLTIVAMGTSAPETAVSVSAALKGYNEIALSNVTGSNIFNLLAILGVCAIANPLPINRRILKRDLSFSIAANAAVAIPVALPLLLSGKMAEGYLSQNIGHISRIHGLALLCLFTAYIVAITAAEKKRKAESQDCGKHSAANSALLIVLGLGLVIAGGQVTVNSAKNLANDLGMSENLIGLTVIAIGTSLPEFVTSIVASRKGENDLAVANAIGSDIFNTLFVLGISATLRPISVSLSSLIDLAALIAIGLAIFAYATTKIRIGRTGGLIMVSAYITYMAYAAAR